MKILVADDDKNTAESFCMLLRLTGHEVCTAADGQEAVDLARSFRPAMAMLDIVMPKLDGYEAASQIRALLPEVLLVAITGLPGRGGVDAYKSAGFDFYLLKPVHAAEVCDLLATHLNEIT
jgi:CheY-like chemotaxis protein